MDFYSLSAKTPKGQTLNMADYNNKVVLIVNTATQCMLTPQFEGLEALHQKYGSKGLVVLGFPCNQFRDQEPEGNDTIEEVCRINYGVTFQLTEKIKVNGKNSHPIFSYLKDQLGGLLGKDIKWNFTKFLISSQGKPYKRYAPTTSPQKIEKDIKRLL